MLLLGELAMRDIDEVSSTMRTPIHLAFVRKLQPAKKVLDKERSELYKG
jgi:hypothetical protein